VTGYALGIDIGTTYSAAAIWRGGQDEVVSIETHRVTVPTVVFADGRETVFGTSAVRRSDSDPAGAAREFKRRVGDPVPLILSSTPYSADRLVALFARWVTDTVVAQLGEPPTSTVVTHPANWTRFQLHLLSTSLAEVGLDAVRFLTEPEAAAYDFAAHSHLQPGQLVLVYDLGGGTFDVALLRAADDGFVHVGEAAGVERLGGIDFDEAVFQHVVRGIPADVIEGARSDETGHRALAQLRRACVEAKEELSSSSVADVSVLLPGYSKTVRVTRSEYEAMIGPLVQQTADLLRRVLEHAHITPADLSAILLVGGASRTPLVGELVSAALETPVRVDAHPKLVVARGAARWAGAEAPPSEPTGPAPRWRRWAVVGALVLAAGAAVVLGVRLATGPSEGEASDTETTIRTGSTPASTPASTAGTVAGTTVPPDDGDVTVGEIEFLGRATIPSQPGIGGTPLGGFSGIGYDETTGTYVAVSDELTMPRLNELAIDLADGELNEGDVTATQMTTLRDEGGNPLPPGTFKGDALAIADVDVSGSAPAKFVVCDEGDVASGRPPTLVAFLADGTQTGEAQQISPWYAPVPGQSGIQPNAGCSSLTAVPGLAPTTVLSGLELPLLEDAGAGSPSIARVAVSSGAGLADRHELGYPLGPTDTPQSTTPQSATHRLVELTSLGSSTVLALEISDEDGMAAVRLFEATYDESAFRDVGPDAPPPIDKKLVLDFGPAGIATAEYQGMALGPELADGRRVLIVVSDNNAGDVPTDVLAFAIRLDPRPA
jgi:actin-like ATPase involved in cell morphogenesis